ncbi:CPBP family glutamic-type intramembrane protease [Leucobacter sp. GX24907]
MSSPGSEPAPQETTPAGQDPRQSPQPSLQQGPTSPQTGADAPAETPAQWAWAQPVVTRTVETEPLEYHRLYRGVANYRWWRPLLVLVLTLTFYLLLSVIFGMVVGGLLFLFNSPDQVFALVETLAIPDTQNPLSVLVGLSSVIVTMIPAVWLAMRVSGVRPAKRVLSVALRVRWGLLGRTAGYAALALIGVNLAVSVTAGLLLSGGDEPIPEMPDIDVQAALISMGIVVLLVPLQAAAEEIVFRGALMQALGAWLRSPWFAILLPAIGFALAHITTYGFWGMLSVGIMGVVAAWLTWRTGGLEAAIALHVVNNLIAFGAMSTGLGGSTDQNDDGITPIGILAQAVSFVLFIWLTLRGFRKGRHGRTRVDLIQVPVLAQPDTASEGEPPLATSDTKDPRP